MEFTMFCRMQEDFIGMASQPPNFDEMKPQANNVTTLLASGWGLVSAYVLFAAIAAQIPPKAMFITVLATLFPLIAVWATIERKRWGRLALLGLSATAIGLFIAFIGLVVSPSVNGISLDRMVNRLPAFAGRPVWGALILLAIFNAFWLRRPTVVAEFEYKKRKTLAIAQRVIATSLVGCWGMIMVLAPCVDTTALKPPVLLTHWKVARKSQEKPHFVYHK